MRIDVNAPEGNIFSILGIGRRLLLAAGNKEAADKLFETVRSAETYHDACKAVHDATGGAITFWDDDTQLEFEEDA